MDGFQVDLDELHSAAATITQVVGGVDDLGTTDPVTPNRLNAGGAALGEQDVDDAFTEFIQRWGTGVTLLRVDARAMSQAMTFAANAYARVEQQVAASLASGPHTPVLPAS